MENTKKCSKCDRELPLECFGKDKSKKDGLECRCKQCRAKHYQDNREKILEQQKQYNAENADLIKERHKQYYQTLEGIAYKRRFGNLYEDRKYERCGDDEDPLPSLEYYMWGLQQPDFYDGKYYPIEEMGFDRIYNDKPHTFANVVPCSTANNRRRGRKTFEEFKALMQQERNEFDLVLN